MVYKSCLLIHVTETSQEYEIAAKDKESGGIQYAKSSQPEPRNLYFQEGHVYSLTFMSIGGNYLDDLPYKASTCNLSSWICASNYIMTLIMSSFPHTKYSLNPDKSLLGWI